RLRVLVRRLTAMAGATPGFAFVEGALDRAEFLRTRGDRLAELWPDARLLRLDADGRALCATGGAPVDERGAAHPALQAEAVLLGMEGGRAWFAAPDPATDPGAPRVDLRTAAASWPVREATAFAQARAVLHWRARHRHCGACGARLRFERAGWLGRCEGCASEHYPRSAPRAGGRRGARRHRHGGAGGARRRSARAGWPGRCEGCASEHYPRTDPAVIVAVTDGERLLLGRQADWPPRRYSTLAGFVEPGETLEQTVVREVFEESAVRVRRCRYLASQPWPFPSSLMLGFIAEAEPDVPRPSDEEL